jgi:hypothetical protein
MQLAIGVYFQPEAVEFLSDRSLGFRVYDEVVVLEVSDLRGSSFEVDGLESAVE